LAPVEPDLQGHPVEDALTAELRLSRLGSIDAIVRLLDRSADAFRGPSPEYNACLTLARTALETIAREIAEILKRTTCYFLVRLHNELNGNQ
jgi:hypothetical protein